MGEIKRVTKKIERDRDRTEGEGEREKERAS